jgi:hypothetical protein
MAAQFRKLGYATLRSRQNGILVLPRFVVAGQCQVVVHTGNLRIDNPLASHLICCVPCLVAVKNDPVHSLSGVTVALEVALNFSPLSFDLTPLSFAASR